MMEVNQDTIQEFIKLLIELTGAYEITEDHRIKNRMTDQYIVIPLAKTEHDLAIWYEGAPVSTDWVWLNPFKENIGRSPGREWFYSMLNCAIGEITKCIMLKVIKDCASNADDNYNEFALMSKVRSKIDDKTMAEVEKLGKPLFLSIFYNKTKRTAEAQTELFSDNTKQMFPKIRTKTWEAIEIMFKEIFRDDLDSYRYQAKLLDIPETDAKLHVIIGLLTTLDPYAQDLLNKDLHSAELQAHLDVLEGYAKLYAWVGNQTDFKPAQPAMSPYGQPMGPTAPQYLPNGDIPRDSTGYPLPSNTINRNPVYGQPYGYPNMGYMGPIPMQDPSMGVFSGFGSTAQR